MQVVGQIGRGFIITANNTTQMMEISGKAAHPDAAYTYQVNPLYVA
jgi:hypothetical protein